MPTEIRMPELGAEIEHADLVSWLVAVGDEVSAGDLIAEIETDKATVEFESPHSGTIVELCVKAGAREVKVGELIARIEESAGADADPRQDPTAGSSADSNAGSNAGSNARSSADAEPAQTDSAATVAPVESIAPASSETPEQPGAEEGSSETPSATALARRIAEQSGVELSNVQGSGAHGRIRRADVDAVIGEPSRSSEAAAAAAEEGRTPKQADLADESDAAGTADDEVSGERVAHSRMRKTIAARLSEAKREIPHFYLDLDVTIDTLLGLRKRWKADDDGVSISVNDFVIAAAARAVREVPEVNASWSDEAMILHDSVDVAVAVATDGGLVTPIIRDADRKGLGEISAEMKELAERARARKLAPEEYRGGSFSISNLGMFGIGRVYAIVNPPHACILGVGRGEARPVVVDGDIAIATQMTLTLSADHRVIDGAVGARFLAAVAQRLRNPLEIML